MKKIFITSLIVLLTLSCPNAQAFNCKFCKKNITNEQIVKNETKNLKDLMQAQIKFVNNHDVNSLSNLYSKDFINNDGFGKEVYFQLIKDTWETYPSITYKSTINDIEINDNYATVEATEYATALAGASEDINDGISAYGELNTVSKCIYSLEKNGNKWLVTSENVLSEQSSLKFGQAKYMKININSPKQINYGEDYTSSLNLNLPQNSNAIASITREKITYPQEKGKDSFRTLSHDDNVLERVFTANKDNVNEYNIAAVAIGTEYNGNVAMTGAAFVITRVNVVPKNKFIEDIKKVEKQQKADANKLKEEFNNAKGQ